MSRVRFIMATVCVLATSTIVTSCDLLESALAPCPPTSEPDDTLMDGLWRLTTIDGKPIPEGTGFKLPGVEKYLMSGSAFFTTTAKQQDGNCKAVLQSSGYIDFLYKIRTPASTNSSMYPGRFRRDHEDNTTSLGADKYTVQAEVSGPDNVPAHMEITAEVKVLGIGVEYTLVFERRINP